MSDETHVSAKPSGSQTPPRVSVSHGDEGGPEDPERPAASGPEEAVGLNDGVARLKQRRDFLKTARAFRAARPGLNVQGRERDAAEPATAPVRIGFTCTKKVGGAVQRNRAKRRLREAVRLTPPELLRRGWDYVLIGRRDATAARAFDLLLDDLSAALAEMHAKADRTGAGR